MVRHKCVRELIPRDSHGQKLRNSVRQEWLFQNFSHAGALLGLFDQHVGDDAFQIIGIGGRDGGVVATQDFEHEALHGVGVKGVPQCDHLVEDAAQRPYVRLLVVRLLLADLRREVVRSTDGRLGAIVSVLKHACNTEISDFNLP